MRLVHLVAIACLACSTQRPRDVGPRVKMNPRSEFEESGGGPIRRDPREAPTDAGSRGTRPRVLVHARARALATDATRLYFGDAADDVLYAMPKTGGTKEPLSRRAPSRDGLAVSDDSIVWIASPGDTILRASLSSPDRKETIAQGSVFAQVAADGGLVFFTLAVGQGGALDLVTKSAKPRIMTFAGPPRGLALDATHAYVVTPTRILRSSRERHDGQTIATGTALAGLALDERFAYTTAFVGGSRCIVRAPKEGVSFTTVVKDVSSEIFAIRRGEVAYVDTGAAALRATSLATGATRIVSEDPSFAQVSSLLADDDGFYLATGEGESAHIAFVPAE